MAHTKVTKTHSQNTGVANTFSYSGSFDVFKGTEVQAELDNIALTYTASTINESASPREYTVDTSAKTIHIGGADLSSGTIIIRPVTDMGAPTPRATYAPGSSITSEDLNNNQTQLMRKAMEYDEQKLSSLGGTMTGHLTMGEDQTIIFEGATDDGYETTLTVADPTADRTITLPNVTGTVITTGDTGTVTATILAADSVDSSELVDGSIDTSHISTGAVTTAKLAADAVDSTKLADNAVDSEHYTDGSIDTAHIADLNVTTAKIAADAITGAKIADDAIDSEHYTDGSIDTAHIADLQVTTAKIAADAITGAKIADDAIDSEHYTDGSIDTAHIADSQVTTAKIAADAITGAKIADDAIDSEHYTDASIDTAHITDANVTAVKLASNAVTTAKITDANVTTDKLAADSVTIAKIGCEQTTISDSDSHIPTSGAVVDYVAAQIAPIGGLEVIADEDNFPSIPASGVVISIADAAGIVVNGSGTSTTARTAGNGSDNVTINNFPSSLYSETLASGVGLMVTSTGSSNTYNYHKLLAAETDVKQLSDDINDFNARYRVNAGEPGSNNDEGDLVYDTNADKMKVYDSSTSAWKEVTSTGDFKYLVMTNPGTTDAATLNGSNYAFDLKETSTSGSAASVTSAAQLIVSINGVIQKANTGTNRSGLDGFVMADADTINFCAGVPSSADVFIVQIGSAVTVPTPGDGTVSTAKIANGAVTTAKLADSNVTVAKMAANSVDSDQYVDGSVDHVHLAADCVDGDNIQDDVINSEHIAAGAVDLEHMSSQSVDEDNLHISNAGTNGQYLSKQSGNAGGLTWADVSTQDTLSHRNIIINGAMLVAQRGTSSGDGGYTTVDRWSALSSNTDQLAFDQKQTTDYPSGFSKCYEIDITTAEDALAANELCYLRYKVEAQDLRPFYNNDGTGKNFTLSFWVKAKQTGTYQVSIHKEDNTTRFISATYTVSSAETWEKKTINITGDTGNSGVNADAGQGFDISWKLAAGTDYTSGTPQTSWGSFSNAVFAAGHAVNVADNAANYFRITGVQLELGDTATDFEHRSYGDELTRCQRYYQLGIADGVVKGTSSSSVAGRINFQQTMRAEPTIGKTSGDFKIGDMISWSTTAASPTINNSGYKTWGVSQGFSLSGMSGFSSGGIYRHENNASQAVFTLSAEL